MPLAVGDQIASLRMPGVNVDPEDKRVVPGGSTGLSVIGRVNGEQRQHGSASQMVFDIATLLSFISNVMTLEPGDLVSTGTPEGVGPLVAGDTVEVEIPGVGVLKNSVR